VNVFSTVFLITARSTSASSSILADISLKFT